MTNEIKKCPNCGHKFKEGEEYCPNCDLFIPINEQTDTENLLDPGKEKQFKTFKEKKIENENSSEPLFKHRTKTTEDVNEIEENSYDEEVSLTEVSNDEETDRSSLTEPLESYETNSIDADDAEIEDILPTEDHPIDSAPILDIEEKISEVRSSDKALPTPKNNKTKLIAGISAAVVLIAGGSYFYSVQQKNNAEQDRLTLVSTTEDDISSLYASKDKIFLKNGITQTDLDNAKKSLDKLKTKEGYDKLKEEFDTAEDKFNKQKAINELFKTPIISGDDLAEKTYVKDSTAVTLNKIDTEKDAFDILYNKALTEAKTQKDSLKSVEEKIAVVFKDDEVVKSATREEYEEALTAINTLKDEDMKTTLTANIKKVDTVLVAAEKKKAEEEATAAAAAQVEQNRLAAIEAENQAAANTQSASNNNSSSSSSTPAGTTTPGKYGNREDSTKDFNDAAWAWNPGIQNEVMTEVIKRGYVVEGGYSLVPKYVENGEGYYDLYATTNSKIFPDSKPEEFPLYVVTINVKTGSFFGNGPN